jgi:putative transposase
MARLPRLTLAGHPHHVIQRGNNRQPIFLSDDDRLQFLQLLAEYAEKFKVAVHAYVLMDNHIHLLATPASDDGLPQMMQALGRRYVRYFNDRHARTGTLWEGRYRSTLIQTERYLLACMVYIDLNPVRAGIVAAAADFAWSSHRHYAGLRADRQITPHPLYWALGNTPFAREAAYAELVHAGVTSTQSADMTAATLSGWALGSAEFLENLQKDTGRRLSPAKAGRPVSVKNQSP